MNLNHLTQDVAFGASADAAGLSTSLLLTTLRGYASQDLVDSKESALMANWWEDNVSGGGNREYPKATGYEADQAVEAGFVDLYVHQSLLAPTYGALQASYTQVGHVGGLTALANITTHRVPSPIGGPDVTGGELASMVVAQNMMTITSRTMEMLPAAVENAAGHFMWRRLLQRAYNDELPDLSSCVFTDAGAYIEAHFGIDSSVGSKNFGIVFGFFCLYSTLACLFLVFLNFRK